jgi:hypothetical protein
MGIFSRVKELVTGKKSPPPVSDEELLGLLQAALRQAAAPATPPTPPKPQMSLLKMLMDQNVEVEYEVCPMDGNTTPISTKSVWVYGNSTTIQKMPPDIGGFCSKCQAYRCASHSIYVAMTLAMLRESGGDDIIPDATLLGKVAEITKQPVDSVFILGCRTCHGFYEGKGGMQQIVLS